MLRVFRVQGDSMRPDLSAGDFVIARRSRRAPRVGDRVVVDHPEYGTLIKRVVASDPNRGIRCDGDNPDSLHAGRIGWLPRRRLIGIVSVAIRAPRRTARASG